jgi:hypothetical protein
MDQQRFLEQLQIVLDPSKGNVKSATSVLQNEFYKQPESLLFLIQLIISHDLTSLKQLAAVEARQLVPKHWTKISANQRPHARSQLLQATIAENDGKVRHAAARLISAIAKLDLNDGEWADRITVGDVYRTYWSQLRGVRGPARYLAMAMVFDFFTVIVFPAELVTYSNGFVLRKASLYSCPLYG